MKKRNEAFSLEDKIRFKLNLQYTFAIYEHAPEQRSITRARIELLRWVLEELEKDKI